MAETNDTAGGATRNPGSIECVLALAYLVPGIPTRLEVRDEAGDVVVGVVLQGHDIGALVLTLDQALDLSTALCSSVVDNRRRGSHEGATRRHLRSLRRIVQGEAARRPNLLTEMPPPRPPGRAGRACHR